MLQSYQLAFLLVMLLSSRTISCFSQLDFCYQITIWLITDQDWLTDFCLWRTDSFIFYKCYSTKYIKSWKFLGDKELPPTKTTNCIYAKLAMIFKSVWCLTYNTTHRFTSLQVPSVPQTPTGGQTHCTWVNVHGRSMSTGDREGLVLNENWTKFKSLLFVFEEDIPFWTFLFDYTFVMKQEKSEFH